MTNRRNNWYNLHESRGYPLDDKATGRDDRGARIKSDIIADLHLRFPSTAGRWAFLGGLTVTDTLVTAVFMGADSPTSASRLVPLASVTVRQPVAVNVNVPLRALTPGVGGFVAFGDVSEPFVGRFSTPLQGLLAARAARAYDPLPVPTLRKHGLDVGLDGLVTLRGQRDIEIVKELVEIEGHGEQEALVIRLRQQSGPSVLAKYIGPCGARPESRNCNTDAIERVNGAIPDCDGNINIDFCGVVDGELIDCLGTILEVSIGLEEACAGNDPERFIGSDSCDAPFTEIADVDPEDVIGGHWSAAPLLAQYDAPVTVAPQAASWTAPNIIANPGDTGVTAAPAVSWSAVAVAAEVTMASSSASIDELCGGPAYCDNFEDDFPDEWWLVNGWEFYGASVDTVNAETPPDPLCGESTDNVPGITTGANQLNVWWWGSFPCASTLDLEGFADMKVIAGGPGANCGFIINMDDTPVGGGSQANGICAYLDIANQRLTLNTIRLGLGLYTPANFSLPESAVVGDWYRLRFRTSAAGLGYMLVRLTVNGLTDTGWTEADYSWSFDMSLMPHGYSGAPGFFSTYSPFRVSSFYLRSWSP